MYKQNPYKIKDPSLNVDPKITSTIKENCDLQTAEVEKNELVLRPDLDALHRAVGETHANGGVKTYLPEGSFVYSNDKSLALDKIDHELFELKEGGNFNKKDNTPAKVVQRSFKPEEYNSMINKLQDKKTDEITKRSASLMLNKYIDTLAKVAYIQEGKKDYPQGTPEFAKNAAPVYDTQVKTDIMEQKQYMKKGGSILSKLALGDYFTDPYLKSKTPQGQVTPTGQSNIYNRGPEYLQTWESIFPGISKMDNKAAQSLIYNYTLQSNPDNVKNMWSTYGLTNKGLQNKAIAGLANKGKFDPNALNPQTLDKLEPAYVDGYFGARQLNPPMNGVVPPVTVTGYRPKPQSSLQVPGPTYQPLPPQKKGTEQINWEFNPYQKANMALDAMQYLGTKQQYPYRSQIQSPLVELEKVNPQSALNQVNNAAYQSYQNNRGINPYLASSNNAQTFGRSLDAQNQIQSQYDNQNVQIANQQNLTNNQIQRQDQQFNVQSDQRYYDQVQEGNKNYDNLKQFGLNNLRNSFNQYVTENQSLAYTMAQNPYAPFKYDFKTGQFNLTGNRNILDSMNPNARQENILDTAESLRKQGYSDKLIGDILKSKTVQNWIPQKKGGIIGNPYKKKK